MIKKEVYFKGSKIYTGDNSNEKLQIIHEKLKTIKDKILEEFKNDFIIEPCKFVSINYLPEGKFNIPMHAEKTKDVGSSSKYGAITNDVYSDIFKIFLGIDRKIILEYNSYKKTISIKNNMMIKFSGTYKNGIPVDKKITSDMIVITFI